MFTHFTLEFTPSIGHEPYQMFRRRIEALSSEDDYLLFLRTWFPAFDWEYDDGGADAGFLQFVASTSTGVYPYLLALFE